MKAVAVRVAARLEGIVVHAEVVASEIPRTQTDAAGVRNRNVAGHAGSAGSADLGGDRADARIPSGRVTSVDPTPGRQDVVGSREVISRVVME